MTQRRSKKKRIVVCDDETQVMESWAGRLRAVAAVKAAFEVTAADPEEFKAAVSELEQRRRNARDGGKHQQKTPTLIDRADVLLVDYDLMQVYEQSYLTGEVVAYLARCYSDCGLIIGMNQFGDNSFDLTLARESQSYADFNIGSKQVSQPGLWDVAEAGFRPWRWPNIDDAVADMRRRAREVGDALDTPIVEYLGLKDVETFPREITEFIKVTGTQIGAVTFRDFVTSSGNGLRRKDKADDQALARIAAARISKWLEDFVLPAQDVLVDAPHLVGRLPEVMTGNISRLETWNKTTGTDLKTLGIRVDGLKAFQFSARSWLSRPAWLWRDLQNATAMQTLRSSRKGEVPDYVFCEDISRFVPRKQAREFVAEVPSAFNRRYISNPSTVALPAKQREFLASVTYQPEVRLAL